MITKEIKRAKAHKLLKNNDPSINPLSYSVDLINACNYFNTHYSNKDYKQWVLAYYTKVKFSPDIPDHKFKTLGMLVRLLGNGNSLSEKHSNVVLSEFKILSSFEAVVVKVETPIAPRASIQEKMDDKVSEFLGEFAGVVDEYATSKTLPNVDALVRSMGIRGPMVKKVMSKVESIMQELRDAISGSDAQLVEGYSQFRKPELKKLFGIYETLIAALGQAKVSVIRKTRSVKVKPPTVITKSVKYQTANEDLHIKSIEPALIVGASELWVFNAKYRKLQCYEASPGATLTVKGTTLLNFDTVKSVMKTVKKTEVLHSLMGKRMYAKFFKETRGTEKPCNGRINGDCLLMAVF